MFLVGSVDKFVYFVWWFVCGLVVGYCWACGYFVVGLRVGFAFFVARRFKLVVYTLLFKC